MRSQSNCWLFALNRDKRDNRTHGCQILAFVPPTLKTFDHYLQSSCQLSELDVDDDVCTAEEKVGQQKWNGSRVNFYWINGKIWYLKYIHLTTFVVVEFFNDEWMKSHLHLWSRRIVKSGNFHISWSNLVLKWMDDKKEQQLTNPIQFPVMFQVIRWPSRSFSTTRRHNSFLRCQ